MRATGSLACLVRLREVYRAQLDFRCKVLGSPRAWIEAGHLALFQVDAGRVDMLVVESGDVGTSSGSSTWCPGWSTAATLPDDAGLTARQVVDILGHARPSMTQDVHTGRGSTITVEPCNVGRLDAYHYVQDYGGIAMVEHGGHPCIGALRDALHNLSPSGAGVCGSSRVRPPVWRRVLVRAGATSGVLHQVIPVVMDWDDEPVGDGFVEILEAALVGFSVRPACSEVAAGRYGPRGSP
ncbi:plasmid pRiA4b ORF-3 family protein [Kutzneria buriramensis]|uniref:plasmid pRiA4b ORF-3 family protein n=1 Tax=Kutzneria buriramensis TaxID=1045776 RepID=UPI0011C16E87